ncbi:MAG: carboxypeptidase regulatory-like domain-containing protein [Blastocatellia bacterium]
MTRLSVFPCRTVMAAGALAIFFLASALDGRAQTTFGSITGNVTDANGAIVAGAAIEATHVRSNYRHTTRSNEVGNFTLPQLREGEYTLRATAQGFREFVAQNIQLASREERRLDVQLQVGPVESRVEVTAGATLIETETARIGDSKNAIALKSLPLNTRSLYSFLALSPGVLGAGGGQATRRFAGSRVNQSEQSIDGITVSNGFDGTQISPLVSYIESYEEVRVDMANNSADIGAVGQVTVVSKSGGNELHGNFFDYYATPWFRARNPFAAQRGSGVRHQPGGSVGGPIVIPKLYDGHNRSFFFFSFETSRGSNVLQLLNPTVPLASWRAGDFSNVSTPIRNPFNNNQPFAGNRIPENLINPVSKKIQERFYPLPNFGDPNVLAAQNYREQKSRPFDPDTYYTFRLDHRFSGSSFIFGRWTWNRSHSREYEANLPTIGQRWQTRDTRALNVSYTHSLRPNLVSESRWGFAWNDNPRNGPLVGKEVVQFLGITGLAGNLPDINGLLDVQFQGLGITRITQAQWRHPGFLNYAQQWQQHVNWYRGRHSLKSGFILSRVRFEDNQANAALFGDVRFSNRYTGHPYADFLLGIPTTSSRAFPQVAISRLRWAYDFFVTDDFKVTPRLTLNIGVRYELHPSYTEENGLQSNFDIERGRIVVPRGSLSKVSPLLPRNYVEVIEADGARLLKTDRNNFAPRIGLAYRPWGNDTVIRAGFGVFYDVVSRPESAGGAPFVINEPSFTNPANNPVVIFPRVFPDSVAGPTTITIPTAIRPDIQTPYSMQYNLTVEHQRWNTGFRLSYIGTNTRQGDYQFNINQPVADNRPYVDKPRRFPNYPGINYLTNGAGHQYHSLTVEVERRFLKGLSYQGSWVWARDIGDLDRGASPENAYDRGRERGVWLDIPTHRVTGNLIYELPFGRGKRWLNSGSAAHAVFGGWEISGIYGYHSGQFLTPMWTGPDPTGTAFTASRTPAQVTIRPDQLRDPNLPSSERTTSRWFDASAFSAPTAGRFGTAARGVIKGPTSNVFHAGLAKYFNFGERLRLRLDITSTNLFNHPNYSPPEGGAVNISQTAQVGVLSGVGGTSDLDQSGARSFRAGIRLEW